jgi:replicative DNA helicase
VSVPPYDRDAELSVLGCILSAGSYSPKAGQRILERVRATGIAAHSFWFPSHAALYAILEQRAGE